MPSRPRRARYVLRTEADLQALVAANLAALAYLRRHKPQRPGARQAWDHLTDQLENAIADLREEEVLATPKRKKEALAMPVAFFLVRGFERGREGAPDLPPPASLGAIKLVYELCRTLDQGGGAPWEDLVESYQKARPHAAGAEAEVEAALNYLLDHDIIYEPQLGRLKRV